MINPRDPIHQIIALYPTTRKLYENKHVIEDDSLNTEEFCNKYDIPLVDFWMEISKEASRNDSAKAELAAPKIKVERERKERKNMEKPKQSKHKRIDFKTMTKDERELMVFAYTLLLGGEVLFFVSSILKLGHGLAGLSIGIALAGSAIIAGYMNNNK